MVEPGAAEAGALGVDTAQSGTEAGTSGKTGASVVQIGITESGLAAAIGMAFEGMGTVENSTLAVGACASYSAKASVGCASKKPASILSDRA